MNRVLERNTVQKSEGKDASTQKDKKEIQIATAEQFGDKNEKKEISTKKILAHRLLQGL